MEKQSLINTPCRTYKRRWYVLSMLCLLSCVQNGVWATWGPIAQSAKLVFNWTDTTIFMLVNSGNIALMVIMLPATWLLRVKGFRITFLLCSVILTAGTGVRCITSDPTNATWLIFIGQSLNGVAGTIGFAGPSLLSEQWFPHDQRTTATAISLMFSSIGAALVFIVGPQIVPQPHQNDSNTTGNHNMSVNFNYTEGNRTDIDEIRERIMIYNYLQFGLSALIMVVSLLYLPDKPPTPPSATAAIERIDFISSLKQVIRSIPFWHISIIYGFSTGVFGVTGATLGVFLNQLSISQEKAGWLGFYGSVASTVAAFIFSRLADIFNRHTKLFLISIYSLSTLLFIWFTLMTNGYVYYNIGLLYTAYIAGGLFLIGAMPLFYEISCESAYPVSEGITTGFLTLQQNLGGTLVLLVSLVPNIGTTWITWCLVGSVGGSAIGLCFYRIEYRRSQIDLEIQIRR